VRHGLTVGQFPKTRNLTVIAGWRHTRTVHGGPIVGRRPVEQPEAPKRSGGLAHDLSYFFREVVRGSQTAAEEPNLAYEVALRAGTSQGMFPKERPFRFVRNVFR
jgi:hypothetical protein